MCIGWRKCKKVQEGKAVVQGPHSEQAPGELGEAGDAAAEGGSGSKFSGMF